MSEWYYSQKKTSSNFCRLLQEHTDKKNLRRAELTREEVTKLAKLETTAVKLRCGDSVQYRQLQRWLSEDEYVQIEEEWQDQLELRKELKDKPSEFKRYEAKLTKAIIMLVIVKEAKQLHHH